MRTLVHKVIHPSPLIVLLFPPYVATMSHEESDETVAASKLTSARAKRTLVFPRCLSNSNFPENITNKDEDQFQVSVHQCSRAMQRDMKEFFHHLSDEQLAELKIITTCQKSLVDLVEWGNDQAKEKDRLLEKVSEILFLVVASLLKGARKV